MALPWTNWQGNSGGSTNGYVADLDPDWLASLGYTGSPFDFASQGSGSGDSGGQTAQTSQAFKDWLMQNGYGLQTSADQTNNLSRVVGRDGNQVGATHSWSANDDPGNLFGLAVAGAAGFGGAAALGAGALGGAGEAAAGGGLSSADTAALYGANGYGATGIAATDASGAGLSGLGLNVADTGDTFGSAFGVDPTAAAQLNAAADGTGGSTTAGLFGSGGSGGGLLSSAGSLLTSGSGGASDLAKLLIGGGIGAATGAFSKGNTSDLNKVNYQQAATASGQSGRTNQTNAQGSLTYNQNGVDAQGNPTYSQDVKLNGPYQQNLDSALKNQGTALSNQGAYNSGLPAAYAAAPSLYGNAGSQSDLAHQQQDAMYDQQKRYLDPQFDIQSKALDAQLANQGVTYGSEAYNNAHTQFGSQQNQAYGAARDSAINSGNQYANTLFNQNLQANQQYNTNLNNQGANYANQSSGALNGVVQNPTFAATPGQTNYLGAAQLQGAANVNQYNANIGNANNVTNGLTSLGTSLASNPKVWQGIGTGLTSLFGG